jgi:hypothetical protein
VGGAHVRVALALAATMGIALAGIVFSSGGTATQQWHPAAPAFAGPSRSGEAGPIQNAGAHPSAGHGQTVSVARGRLTPPLRSVTPPVSANRHRRSDENENESLPLQVALGSGFVGDGALQTSGGSGAMPSPAKNFDGVGNSCNCFPPDTNGDVGPTHYMQWVNMRYAIWNKTTGAQVVAPTDGNALFAGHEYCGTLNDGDPVVLYDQFSGRWVAGQLALPNEPLGPFYECVAVSTSNNPTGTWCSYEFKVHATKMNDYPKLGVWPAQNAYMMTANQFDESAGYAGVGLYAFERTKMIASGCPVARMVYQDMESIDPYLPFILPADADGPTPPPAGAPATLIGMNFDGSGLPQDQLQLWNVKVDWSGTPSMSVSHDIDLQAAAYDTNLCDNNGQNCIEQPGTTARLQTFADRIMHRAQYRNFGGWETIVTSHTVDAGGDRAAPRWYHIERIGSGNWSIHDQGTYAPSSDTLSRWMPSAAMDRSGDIAIGYSAANSATFPGVRYAGRLASDAPGELAQGEATLIAGTGSETDARGRWGDYSNMAVDPVDDCTFWYTQEYIQATGIKSWKTRIGSFKFASCGPPPAAPPPPVPPPPPPQPPPLSGDYTTSIELGRPIIPGSADIGLHCDDCWREIAFPFSVSIYGQTFTSANVNSNGVINFSGPNLSYLNTCLPASNQGNAVVLMWDDLITSDEGEGVFTATLGAPPNRQFVVEFRAGYAGPVGSANFEAIFTEGSSAIETVYGATSEVGASSTEGIQGGGTGPARQFACNQPILLSGLAVTYRSPPVAPPPPVPQPVAPPLPVAPPPPPPPSPRAVRCRVPRVAGMKLAPAKAKIRRSHCGVGRVRKARSRRLGRVIGQSPRAGVVRKRGFPVKLVVGRR